MNTGSTSEQLEFHTWDGVRSAVNSMADGFCSDAGGLLLREVGKHIGLTAWMSRCWVDHRNRASDEHTVGDLVSQRLYAIALGYEDLNDYRDLRCDAVLALLVGKRDVTGAKRLREPNRGYALASASPLNCMKLGDSKASATRNACRNPQSVTNAG